MAVDTAVTEVKQWDKAGKEIKLGSIAILVKDNNGKIKTQKLGARHTKTGVLGGVLAAILSGGVTLLAGVVVGRMTGGFFRKGLGLSKEDVERIGGELDNGRAAVCILAATDEAEAVAAKLTELGGEAETHEVMEETVEEAATAVEEAAEPEESSEG
ncbi:MAG: hypothetical protein HND44_15090 [Chloroflexi bacterium]|nr:hypothetical protein [Ardenticatenaceae bacterium]MBL1129786.1 hypothetical protein [Chloroflexota bacterium]NOG35871.1 hypothetical protein [Chloroflexota bacterium]GIK55493.1 MAG: hypothetical protein BroJett015_11560 [Chloroflexota bacterium]